MQLQLIELDKSLIFLQDSEVNTYTILTNTKGLSSTLSFE